MLIACEKCKKVFEVNERHLTSGGVTALCPYCEHKHRVKRIVIPYSVSGEEDTEPYDVQDIMEKGEKNTTYVREDDLSSDLEPIEVKSEVVVISRDNDSPLYEKSVAGEEQKSYHIQDRRKGVRGIILDRLISVNFLYLVVGIVVILGILTYAIFK